MARRFVVLAVGGVLTLGLILSLWFLGGDDRPMTATSREETVPPQTDPGATPRRDSIAPERVQTVSLDPSTRSIEDLSSAERAALRRSPPRTKAASGGLIILFGKVEDHARRPIPRATVRWLPRSWATDLPLHHPVLDSASPKAHQGRQSRLDRLLDSSRAVATDSDGRYRMELKRQAISGAVLAHAPGRQRLLKPFGYNANPNFREMVGDLKEGQSVEIEMDFVLGTAAGIAGQVLDGRDGEPVEGLPIWALPDLSNSFYQDPSERAFDTLTDSAGRYRIVGIRPGRYLVLTGRGSGYPAVSKDGAREVFVRAGDHAEDVDFVVYKGGRILAHVRDDQGRPISDAACWIGMTDRNVDMITHLVMRQARSTSNAEGDCSIDGLPLRKKLGLQAGARGFSNSAVVPFVFDDDGLSREIEVELYAAAQVRGRVLDTENRPLKGARVIATRDGQTGARQAQSNGDGTFHLRNLLPGVYRVHASMAGNAPSQDLKIELSAAEDRTGVVLTIDPGETEEVGGIVVDDLNRPVPDAMVSLFGQRGLVQERTDDSGVFVFRRMVKGRYRIQAAKDGLGQSHVPLEVSTGQTNIRIVLPRSGLIRGTLIDERGPLAGAGGRVWTVRRQGNRSAGVGSPIDIEADGSFELLAESGLVTVHGVAPGYASSESEEYDLKPGQTIEGVAIRLIGEAVVRGRVVDSEGHGVSGARVWATRVARNPGNASYGGGQPGGTSDGEGRFTLTGLSAGEAVLHATHNGYAPAEGLTVQLLAGQEISVPPLVLETAGTLAGRVTEEGNPRQGLMISVTAVNATSSGSNGETDANGEFRVSGLKPGPHLVAVMDTSGSRTGRIQVVRQIRVNVSDDREEYVEFDLEGRRIVGRIVNPSASTHICILVPEGTPELPQSMDQKSLVQWFSQTAGQTMTDSTGDFEFIKVRPGRYTLSVVSSDLQNPEILARQPVQVGHVDIEIEVRLNR